MDLKTHIEKLRNSIRLEEKAQEERWIQEDFPLKRLREEGEVIYPIKIKNRKFGITETPILTLSFGVENGNSDTSFSNGVPVTLFQSNSEEVFNGQVLSIDGNELQIILFQEEFPDGLENGKWGVKKRPDDKTFKQMHAVLKQIENQEDNTSKLFEYLHGLKEVSTREKSAFIFSKTSSFNDDQQRVIEDGKADFPVQIIHGPPGTGKTTTLVGLIQNLREKGDKIIAAAPSNAAVDHLALQLIQAGITVMRLGNTAKVNEKIWGFTPEGILSCDEYSKALKTMRIQMADVRKRAQQFKRNFGKEQREQRKLLYQEAKEIRKEITDLTTYYLASFADKADVILGTPVGLQHNIIKNRNFDVAILDEAGQCIEPLAWLVFNKANRIVLAGDHQQLPPTIISPEARREGLSISILEQAMQQNLPHHLLKTQYRMPSEIANFSSRQFYDNKLQSHRGSIPNSLIFYDTAGANFDEKRDENSGSILNEGEANIICENIDKWMENHRYAVVISPYAQQVRRLKELLHEKENVNVSTIDSFQGQEAELIILSLVRSNSEGNIGFLKDYRRMNVALTRAQNKLIVIGDSVSLTADNFYRDFVAYTEEVDGYHSVFELMY